MVFKCINNLAPDYLENKFRFCSCIHDWQTHSASTLDIPFCHLSTGQKSTEEKNCGTHQAVILSLKNVPRNLSANLLSCSQVNLIVLYFYSSDIYIYIYIYLAVTIVLYSLIFVLFLLIICIAAEKPIQGASIKICICDYLY